MFNSYWLATRKEQQQKEQQQRLLGQQQEQQQQQEQKQQLHNNSKNSNRNNSSRDGKGRHARISETRSRTHLLYEQGLKDWLAPEMRKWLERFAP
jgi:hypothetical protein